MAPVKRKPHHQPKTESNPPPPSEPAPVTAPRRATRSVAPHVAHQELELPRRRRLHRGVAPASMATPSTHFAEPPRGKENIPMEMEHHHGTIKPTRLTRHSGPNSTVNADAHRSNTLIPPIPTPTASEQLPTREPAKPRQSQGRRSSASSHAQPPQQHTFKVGRSTPITMTTSSAQPQQPPAPAIGSGNGEQNGLIQNKGQQQSDRNIDKVVLGDICFRTWYGSFYGKEILGDGPGAHTNNAKGGKAGHSTSSGSTSSSSSGAGSKTDAEGGKAHGRRDRDSQPIIELLYVCPCCFKYSKELVPWYEHWKFCEEHGCIPGRKIYTHPKGRRIVQVPSGPPAKPGRGKRPSGGQLKVVEEVVEDKGEWSVWEVDGEKDVLFCQNLSLFAKLFLDNKSVFFNVTGFNYFLLVYTPPAPDPLIDPTTGEVGETPPPPRGTIIGFFSKEKMSWDNNNLACILIFPPWQRKGLGALLMGVSYEISRREGLLGGPEKPISDLGKKGYKRFWAGEIARWLLSVKPDEGEEVAVIDVAMCSQATWIAPEDCLLVLREMNVAKETTPGPPLKKRKAEPEENGAGVRSGSPAEEELVDRVMISQADVRAWVTENGIDLAKPCDPDGFIEGYAIKTESPTEEEAI